MQTNNIDHCTRLCHSPSVEAMLATLGSGATSNSYTDYENAGCLVVIGCDPTSNHPVAASRMRRAVVERGAKLIVINPRRIDMCDYADLWLRALPRHRRGPAQRHGLGYPGGRFGGRGFRRQPHRGLRGVGENYPQLPAGTGGGNNRRVRRRPEAGGAYLRPAAVPRPVCGQK